MTKMRAVEKYHVNVQFHAVVDAIAKMVIDQGLTDEDMAAAMTVAGMKVRLYREEQALEAEG